MPRISALLGLAYLLIAGLHWVLPPVWLGATVTVFSLVTSLLLWGVFAKSRQASPTRDNKLAKGIIYLCTANVLLSVAVGTDHRIAAGMLVLLAIVALSFGERRWLAGFSALTTIAWGVIAWSSHPGTGFDRALILGAGLAGAGVLLLLSIQAMSRQYMFFRWKSKVQTDALIELQSKLESAIDRLPVRGIDESGMFPAISPTPPENGLWDWDVEADKLYLSGQWRSMLGYEATEVEADLDGWIDLVHPDDQQRLRRHLKRHLNGDDDEFFSDYRIRDSGGEYVRCSAHARTNRDRSGKVVRLSGAQAQATDAKQTQARLIRQTHYDSLTGLSNRVAFRQAVELAVARMRRDANTFGVVMLGLDRFRDINDSFGHAVGDQLLIEVANRLDRLVRPHDAVARISGDEFAVLLNEVGNGEVAMHIAERLQEAIVQPCVVSGFEVKPSVTVGLATGQVEQSAEQTIQNATIALNRAKARGAGSYRIFDSQMHRAVLHKLQLETDLRRALARDQIRVFYQPIVSLKDRSIRGFEALVRWDHPEHGFLTQGRSSTWRKRPGSSCRLVLS